MVNRIENHFVDFIRIPIHNHSDVAELTVLYYKLAIGAQMLEVLREFGKSLREQGKRSEKLHKIRQEKVQEQKCEEASNYERTIEVKKSEGSHGHFNPERYKA